MAQMKPGCYDVQQPPTSVHLLTGATANGGPWSANPPQITLPSIGGSGLSGLSGFTSGIGQYIGGPQMGVEGRSANAWRQVPVGPHPIGPAERLARLANEMATNRNAIVSSLARAVAPEMRRGFYWDTIGRIDAGPRERAQQAIRAMMVWAAHSYSTVDRVACATAVVGSSIAQTSGLVRLAHLEGLDIADVARMFMASEGDQEANVPLAAEAIKMMQMYARIKLQAHEAALEAILAQSKPVGDKLYWQLSSEVVPGVVVAPVADTAEGIEGFRRALLRAPNSLAAAVVVMAALEDLATRSIADEKRSDRLAHAERAAGAVYDAIHTEITPEVYDAEMAIIENGREAQYRALVDSVDLWDKFWKEIQGQLRSREHPNDAASYQAAVTLGGRVDRAGRAITGSKKKASGA